VTIVSGKTERGLHSASSPRAPDRQSPRSTRNCASRPTMLNPPKAHATSERGDCVVEEPDRLAQDRRSSAARS